MSVSNSMATRTLDVVVHGGQVVTPTDVLEVAVGTQGGRIVALAGAAR